VKTISEGQRPTFGGRKKAISHIDGDATVSNTTIDVKIVRKQYGNLVLMGDGCRQQLCI